MKRSNFGRDLTVLPGLLSLRKQPVTYLDTNALSDLSRMRDKAAHIDGIEQVRRDLCSFASKRTIAVSQWLFAEMAGFEGGKRRADFEVDMTYVNRLQHVKVLRASGEMMRLEVQGFTTHRQPIPFIDANLPISFDDAEWRRIWAEERHWLNGAKAEFVEWEKDAANRIDEHYPDRAERARRLAEDWQADQRGILVRFIRHQMKLLSPQLGLPGDQSAWPEPEQVSTLWCNWTYRITRDMLFELAPELELERRPSDFVDWCHYMTAAHADELVTSDGDFLKIAGRAPGPKPEILSLEDWVERLRRE